MRNPSRSTPLAPLLFILISCQGAAGITSGRGWSVKDSAAEAAAWHHNIYRSCLPPLLATTALLAWFTRPQTSGPLPPAFSKQRWLFLIVWFPAVMADWFQGPYVYALYSDYGYDDREIGKLYVAGFASSMVFGTLVGSIADRYGRKRCAELYCVLYIISCISKHTINYHWLMFGRITGGIATSLLFSTFECWMVSEHCERLGFSVALLRYMFGLMFFVMYSSAILAGVIADAFVNIWPLRQVGSSGIYFGGYTTPFDISICVLLVTWALISALWEENYGVVGSQNSFVDSCRTVTRMFIKSPAIFLLGLVVATFEASMYAFVFKWTPALSSASAPPPHGLVFSLFMMACMCGSSIFSLTDPNIKPAHVLLVTVAASLLSLSFVALCLAGSTQMLFRIFCAFLVFEFCVGIYFPAVGTLKSSLVPEEARTAVYNTFRIPLNAAVCILILAEVPMATCFILCSVLLSLALIGMIMITSHIDKRGNELMHAYADT